MDIKVKVTNRKILNIINKTMERVEKGKVKYKEAKFHICLIREADHRIIVSSSVYHGDDFNPQNS